MTAPRATHRSVRRAELKVASSDAQPEDTTSGARGDIGRTVTLTMLSGLLLAVVAVVGPFAGAEEHVITASLLGSFAIAWALLAQSPRAGRISRSGGHSCPRPP